LHRQVVDNIAEGIVEGCPVTGNEGSTLWPTNPKEQLRYGVRIDWGRTATKGTDGHWYRDLNLQINADAEQRSIQELGKKMGTDFKYVTLLIPVTSKSKCELDAPKLADQFDSEELENGGM
jgi:hypothetical protein